jgi:3-dehydroquinate dehydratase-1
MTPRIRKQTYSLCIPVTSANGRQLLTDVREALACKPDFIEWRRDSFKGEDLAEERRLLKTIEEMRGGTGLIYTFRSVLEGGAVLAEDALRLQAIKNCIDCGGADYIDVELNSAPGFVPAVRQSLQGTACGLILSCHDFQKTREPSEIHEILQAMEEAGGDVLKLAMTAKNAQEAREAAEAVIAYSLKSDRPVIHIAMGEGGRMTRIFPEWTGGSMTFAAGRETTAPGQMDADTIRKLRRMVMAGTAEKSKSC